MKEGIHPNYRDVCFVDLSNGFKFVTRSCAQTREMVTMDEADVAVVGVTAFFHDLASFGVGSH